jgi:hypothetical protein
VKEIVHVVAVIQILKEIFYGDGFVVVIQLNLNVAGVVISADKHVKYDEGSRPRILGKTEQQH